MKEYLISIIWISIIMGISELLAPHIQGKEKYIKIIGALCVLCVIAAPLVNITSITENISQNLKNELLEGSEGDEYQNYQKILFDYLNSYSDNAYKEKIKELLEKNFNIPINECDVILIKRSEGDNIILQKIQIILSGKSIFKNPYDIEEYIYEISETKCEVLIS